MLICRSIFFDNWTHKRPLTTREQRVSSATTDLQITPNTTPHTVLCMLNPLTAQDFLCKLVFHVFRLGHCWVFSLVSIWCNSETAASFLNFAPNPDKYPWCTGLCLLYSCGLYDLTPPWVTWGQSWTNKDLNIRKYSGSHSPNCLRNGPRYSSELKMFSRVCVIDYIPDNART